MSGIIRYNSTSTRNATGWRRLIGCLKLQVIFRKRATNYRALLRKMTYKDKASYDSTPPCTLYSSLQFNDSCFHIATQCHTLPHATTHCHTKFRLPLHSNHGSPQSFLPWAPCSQSPPLKCLKTYGALQKNRFLPFRRDLRAVCSVCMCGGFEYVCVVCLCACQQVRCLPFRRDLCAVYVCVCVRAVRVCVVCLCACQKIAVCLFAEICVCCVCAVCLCGIFVCVSTNSLPALSPRSVCGVCVCVCVYMWTVRVGCK